MKRVLGLFLKLPVPGTVKTRLAGELGEAQAADAYRNMVFEVIRQAKLAAPDQIVVFFSPAENEQQVRDWLMPWLRDFPRSVSFVPQSQGDLGARLRSACESILKSNGSTGLLLAGTDCIELDWHTMLTAWNNLEENPESLILGPCSDGGYYLLGTTKFSAELFRNIPWSTSKVADITRDRSRKDFTDCIDLVEKSDIDTIEDYHNFATHLAGRPCLFFDRDGVINRSPGPGYVLNKDAFHLNGEIVECLRLLAQSGWLAIVVSSQKGVGKGLMTLADLNEIHQCMQSRLLADRVLFDGIYYYTGSPGSPYRPKPDPAMIDAACREFPINRTESWIVGDADRDIEMGRNANLKGTIRIRGEHPETVQADRTVSANTSLLQTLRNTL